MPDTLPLPSPNKRKLIFVGVIFVVFLLILGGVLMLSGATQSDAGKGFKPETKEVVIWSVNMPETLFETLNKGYNEYLDRSDMKLRVREFGSYTDLLDVLPRVTLAGQSPDVILIPNHGGATYVDPYIVALGENIINITDFEDRFHPLFFDELVFEEKQKIDGTDKIVRGIRGIPVGFEPLGIFYHRTLLQQAPTYWSQISELLTDEAKSGSVSALSLGYGWATPLSGDILPLLTIQHKGTRFDSWKTIDDIASRSSVDILIGYRRPPNNLSQYEDLFDSALTTTDLFVRGKVATLVGYPSTERDILLAQKRAKKDRVLMDDFEKNVRWTSIPQVEEDPKKQTNFARYMYFAMTKTGVNRNKARPANDPVIKFMQYLVTPRAQEVFFKNYEYYLPSQKSLLTSEKDTQIDKKTGTFGMTVADWYVSTQKFIPYDMGVTHIFSRVVAQALDEPGATSSVITGHIMDILKCHMAHLSDPDTYENACECRTDVQSNNNHYWPVCQWGV